MAAAQRLLDQEHCTSGSDLVGGRRARGRKVVRDRTDVIDAEIVESSSEGNYVHVSYFGAARGE
jgi:hypothetical protein